MTFIGSAESGHFILLCTNARSWGLLSASCLARPPVVVVGMPRTLKSGLANEVETERKSFKEKSCGSLHSCLESDDACDLLRKFDGTSHESWNNVMEPMHQSAIQVNPASYAFLLRLVGNAEALSVVKRLHHHITVHGQEKNMYLGNLLVQAYGKCGALDSASSLFVQLQQRNVFSWNTMIGIYGQRQGKVAYASVVQMQLEAVLPNKITFINLLSICASQVDLAKSQQIHVYIIQSGLELDNVLGTALISTYGKCSSLGEASRLFDHMSERNVVSWNVMIAMYNHHNLIKEAFRLFEEMKVEGVIPSKVTFICLVDACATQASLRNSRWVHTCLHQEFESDINVANALVHMYSNCASLQDARFVFDNIPKKDVISWTTMIAGYGQQGYCREALQLLSMMRHDGVNPNVVTFVSILEALVSKNGLFEGRRMHINIIQMGLESNNMVASALINMYCNAGSLSEARMVFDHIPKWDLVSWNTIIAAYVEHGRDDDAQSLFDRMQDAGLIPDEYTFVSMLSVYASKEDLYKGKHLHSYITVNGFEAVIFVSTALVNMYGKSGSLNDAWVVFNSICECTVITWNTLMAGYAHYGYGEETFHLYGQMQQKKVYPDKITHIILLSVCANEADLAKGKLIHICIAHHEFEADVSVTNALVYMYGKCGRLGEANQMFCKLRARDVVSWNTMIALCGQHGDSREALELFEEMLKDGLIPNKVTFIHVLDACASDSVSIEGKSIHVYIQSSGLEADVSVGNALLNMYNKCGHTKDSCSVFERMINRDVFSWTAMIAAYVLSGHGKVAHEFFDRMLQEGVQPDSFTYNTILPAKATHASLLECKRIHTQIRHSGYEADVALVTELVNMYSKWGSVEDSQRVFEDIIIRNRVSWNAIIAAYAQHGHGKKALQVLFSMQEEGVTPNKITFVSVLSACSRSGLIEEGCFHFSLMQQHYGVTPSPKHYDCMTDLFGRAGLLEEVEGLLNEMPYQPTMVSWTILFGACRNQLDNGRGEQAAKQMVELDADNTAPHIALAKVYAMGCQEDDAGYSAALED